MQNYLMYPIVLGCKNTLVNLKKIQCIIYATIYYYVFYSPSAMRAADSYSPKCAV